MENTVKDKERTYIQTDRQTDRQTNRSRSKMRRQDSGSGENTGDFPISDDDPGWKLADTHMHRCDTDEDSRLTVHCGRRSTV